MTHTRKGREAKRQRQLKALTRLLNQQARIKRSHAARGIDPSETEMEIAPIMAQVSTLIARAIY